jgi:hypothetical protein
MSAATVICDEALPREIESEVHTLENVRLGVEAASKPPLPLDEVLQ